MVDGQFPMNRYLGAAKSLGQRSSLHSFSKGIIYLNRAPKGA